MTQKITATERYWVVMKQGTVVQRYDTKGETTIVIPESCNVVSVPDRSALTDKAVDTGVLTDEEKSTLGIVD